MNPDTPSDPNNSFKDIIAEDSQNLENKSKENLFSEEPVKIITNFQMVDSETLIRLRKNAKIVKVLSVILSLTCILYIIPGAWPLIFTFIFPIMGYIGAHKYSDCLNKFYIIYLALIFMAQVIVMGIAGNKLYLVLQSFVLALELVLFVLCVKVLIGVKNLNDSDFFKLRNS